MNRNTLLDELTQDIFAYAMQGAFPRREIARKIKPQELDERFEDYELLLDLHFILKSDVVEFIRDLPRQLRSVRTETQTVSRTRRGTVDGHINWGATIKQRYSQNPQDTALFVCDNRSEDYDIPENIVLKRLLSVIHSTINQSEEYLKEEYDWVRDTWRGEEALINELQRVVERNVHVRRIRDPDFYEPTERMLMAAENSRQTIYRDAARLLRSRDELFAGDRDELKELLDETAITPDDDSSLFELFVLFRFVSTLEKLRDDQIQFKTIATQRQEVARFDSDPAMVLYHNNSAKDRGLSFKTEENVPTRPTTRSEKVQQVAREIANDYFDKNFTDYTGRPDVIVLEIRDESTRTYEYLITEVKYSKNTDTIRQGIKETLEYLAFLQVNGDFIFGDERNEEYFGTGWNGLLVTQDLEPETTSLQDQTESEIKILQASELEDQLNQVLKQLFQSV